MKIKISYIILFFSLTSIIYGQCKKSIEEIAFYHLDKLTREGKLDFKYFSNGYIEQDTTFAEEIYIKNKSSKKDTLLAPNPFKGCSVVESINISKFSITNKMRGERINPILNIFNHVKHSNKYYVGFALETNLDVEGKSVLIILNSQGDLINFRYAMYIW